MKALRERLGLDGDRDAGMTLIEVVVALFIFAIISTGVLYSMLSVVHSTRDSRARHVAANLAAQEIDLARDVADLFTLTGGSHDVILNGDTFTVTVATQWVSDPNTDLFCGAGGGSIKYKRVNVTVEWTGMIAPVRADTVIDPRNRINDPQLGTILVSVLGSSGSGMSGISVTAVPSAIPDGATALTQTPSATDAQGCSYILKVRPGNYDVSISKSGYISNTQETSPPKQVKVTAGASISADFAYDNQGGIRATVGSNAPAGAYLPNNLDTTFIPLQSATSVYYGKYTGSATSTNTAKVKDYSVYPSDGGYEVMAGKFVGASTATTGCLSPDPSAWADGLIGAITYGGNRDPGVSTLPGASASSAPVSVRMGVITLSGNWASGNNYLKAVSATGTPADPGCATPLRMTYTFGQVLPSSGSITIALPYGSWQLFSGSNTSQTSTIASPRMAVTLPSTITPAGSVATLDPRVVLP
ncbi:type II secretion system protein [Leifsonia sp. YIM 134122]|uniref:Type II secretion system protein n=1 Tax=Leifsonia stereocauli TaxID=3134136 RepID=A0ABU9W7U7_9MICO